MIERYANDIFYNACLRKKNYSEEGANKVVDFEAEINKRLMYYYKCEFCGSFHITSREPGLDHLLELK